MKREARQKLAEKNIGWQQVYTQKTQFLKDMFEDVVGSGSYFRFEGESEEGIWYFAIIGPARVHHPRAKFFAGVRRLPATYSAGGKYFDSLSSAAEYAKETWGVETPKELKPYTSSQLFGIASKVTAWKKKHEEEQDDEDKEEGSED